MPKSHYETLTLYYVPESGPCRTVLLAARVIGIELNLKLLDLYEGEHYSKQFLRVITFNVSLNVRSGEFNPMHVSR